MTHLKKMLLTRLEIFLDQHDPKLLKNGLKGIEKESLRISKDGFIANTPHPEVLGSALTHPQITTDYSEALLEFITPPFSDINAMLANMTDIHQFVYDHLQDEMLLAASMPCGINGDDSIPIAEYGHSNIGQMKHIYRKGLWYRYGRTMQAIAGIHYNYSVPTEIWPLLHNLDNSGLSLEEYISKSYFDLIRNLLSQGWLILYLFGASPAICKNFFKSRPELMAQFDEFDRYTLYHPYATSLRMSDIGYKSKNQLNLKIDYNSLRGYVDSLSDAITTPFPEYEKIGVKVDGEYKQLNGNVLQIENEFYSTVRPKQIANSGEKPTLALKRRGIRYLELRSLDLDLFCPIGIQAETAFFLEAFILTNLFQDSMLMTDKERTINNLNQLSVAHRGRDPKLQLQKGDSTILMRDWAEQILETMSPVCELLDDDNPEQPYSNALNSQYQRLKDPDLTPSARILQKMTETNQPFATFALKTSREYGVSFRNRKLDRKRNEEFIEMSEISREKQKAVEQNDNLTFDEFLNRYFEQK